MIKTDQWLVTNLTWVFRPIPSWLNRPITFNRPDLLHHQLTGTIHLTLKMTSAQVVETSVTNTVLFRTTLTRTITQYELHNLCHFCCKSTKKRVSHFRCSLHTNTVEPRFNEPLFNEVFDITNDILCPGKNHSKMYGIEPRYNVHIPEAQT